MTYYIFNETEYNELVKTFYHYKFVRFYAGIKKEIWVSPYTDTEYIINKENMK